jgi:secreted Zn-dependent insulinase-like peptidase
MSDQAGLSKRSCQRRRHFEIKEDRFTVMKEATERAYRNMNMKPLKHSAYLRLSLLKDRTWHVDDRLAALGRLTADDVRKFAPTLFEKVGTAEAAFFHRVTKAFRMSSFCL